MCKIAAMALQMATMHNHRALDVRRVEGRKRSAILEMIARAAIMPAQHSTNTRFSFN